MNIDVIVPDALRKAYDAFHYAPAVREAGLIFCSGVIGQGDTAEAEFRDAWDNPYDYRYRVLNASSVAVQTAAGAYVSPFADWKSPNFLLVSCGPNYVEPAAAGTMPAQGEYWDTTAVGGATMLKNGLIPTAYFEDAVNALGPFRADNLVNWSN